MPKEAPEFADAGCPWFQRYSRAVFACEAVAGLFSAQRPFASPAVRRLFQARAGYHLTASALPQPAPRTEAGRLLGALLGKLAHRGVPAPCSLAVERHVLGAAQEAGVLVYRETDQAGEFRFSCSPRLPDLKRYVRICLIPELLIDDAEVERLLVYYRSLCTPAESEWFDALLRVLPERRLGLLWLPQRTLPSMGPATGKLNLAQADRVDFALQIPSREGVDWLKLAVELDDATHTKERKKQDEQRDAFLQLAGWRVERFHVARRAAWQSRLEDLAGVIEKALPAPDREAAQQLRAMPQQMRQAIHNLVLLPIAEAQLLAALARLVWQGCPAELGISDPQCHGLQPVTDAVAATLHQMCQLHDLGPVLRIHLEPTGDIQFFGSPAGAAWQAIQQQQTVLVPGPVWEGYVEPLTLAPPHPIHSGGADRSAVVRAGLDHVLQNVFRKVQFRTGQVEIVERALTLKPVVGLLPTGAGKSLCFQLASLVQPGFTLVVDPLRSLMIDQKENLEALGIHRCITIMSGQESTPLGEQARREDSYRSVVSGHYFFVFVAPERLQMPRFRECIRGFAAALPVPYCVVDEAHCVSEWGHDFRPAYLNVGRVVRQYCQYESQEPCLVALTGTASRNVLSDILRELAIEDLDTIVEPTSLDRPELRFEVRQVRPQERLPEIVARLRALLVRWGWQPGQWDEVPGGLIFTNFATASQLGVQVIADEVRTRLGLPVEIYAGRRPYGAASSEQDWERSKLETQRRFKSDEARVLVCTHSFGMGIDKPIIRFTLHAMLPQSLEDFYQQAGRAGRDRDQAHCLILFSDDQPRLADQLLDTERTLLEDIAPIKTRQSWSAMGDAIRNTYFLTSNFLGRAVEQAVLTHVVTKILVPRLPAYRGDRISIEWAFSALPAALLASQGNREISAEAKTVAQEKALYRLLLVGALADYAKDYSRKCFILDLPAQEPSVLYTALERYLKRYATEYELRQFLPPNRSSDWGQAALDCSMAMVKYVYETIEKRRRRAMGQMLQVARDAVRQPANGEASFRQQLLAYLEESEFSKPVENLAGRIEPAEWFALLVRVEGMDGITKLLGACRRRLEDSPSHPGLLLLAGICRTTSLYPEQGPDDIRSSFLILGRHYPEPAQRLKIALQVIEHVRRLAPSRLDSVLVAILEGDSSRPMVRCCYEHAEDGGTAHEWATRYLCAGILTALKQGGTAT
jgi:RecQ family ATP-dependent DNA helicase